MKRKQVIVILTAVALLVLFDVGLWVKHESYIKTSTSQEEVNQNSVTSPTPMQDQSATVGPQPNTTTGPTPYNSASQRQRGEEEDGGD
jgi:FtsZ-interacting cell division protein ZipA